MKRCPAHYRSLVVHRLASALRELRPSEGDVHVYPTFGREHDTDGGPCWCRPSPDMASVAAWRPGEGIVWVHRAMS